MKTKITCLTNKHAEELFSKNKINMSTISYKIKILACIERTEQQRHLIYLIHLSGYCDGFQ